MYSRSLTHFKGHEATGIGGTIKNLGMGGGSRAGKKEMHADGKPAVNESKCIGCQYCLYACPYGVRTFSEADGVARKCTLCQHLTANGSAEPACVHNCPGGARFYGDLDDPNSSVSRELAKYGDDCIHSLVAPEGEEPLTRYILSPSVASWKELV